MDHSITFESKHKRSRQYSAMVNFGVSFLSCLGLVSQRHGIFSTDTILQQLTVKNFYTRRISSIHYTSYVPTVLHHMYLRYLLHSFGGGTCPCSGPNRLCILIMELNCFKGSTGKSRD
jgi:hypothetical protein